MRLGQLHHHLHVVLDDEDRQVLGDAAHQRHGVVGLRRAHAGRRLVEAQQLRLGGERDADLEVALLAVREVGGELVGLGFEADRLQHGLRLVEDVAEVAWWVSMLQAWRRDWAAMRTFSSVVALGRILVIW